MPIPASRAGAPDSVRARFRHRAGLLFAWGTWLAMTGYLILYVQTYSRDVPFMDDFDMVAVRTGSAPASLEWAWSQHHEHRPLVSRLILLGLAWYVDPDFRAPRYLNVALLSAMSALLLEGARRIRGSASVTDAVLPLAILGLAQAECLLIGFAMNLVLTTTVALGLVAIAGSSRGSKGVGLTMALGLSIVVLPLCGGSGLVMLPPLWVWMMGYVANGWGSGRMPGRTARASGTLALLASWAIVLLYFRGYWRPDYVPQAASPIRAFVAAIRFLSLAVYPTLPHSSPYWRPSAWIVMVLLASTFWLLARSAWRTRAERPGALALMAVMLSMIAVAAALGISRGAHNGRGTLLSRYITLAVPLTSVLYITWLAYGTRSIRTAIHIMLLALVVSTLPANDRFGRTYGEPVRDAALAVEQGLKDHVPTFVLMDRACPILFPDRREALSRFQMLARARVGAFANLESPAMAAAPDAVRR